MWRYLLILVLCGPLLWKVYAEGQTLAESLFGNAARSEEALAGYEQTLKTAGEEAQAKLQVREALVRCVLVTGEDCPEIAGPSQAESALRPKLKDYASRLRDVRRFFVDYAT